MNNETTLRLSVWLNCKSRDVCYLMLILTFQLFEYIHPKFENFKLFSTFQLSDQIQWKIDLILRLFMFM